MLPRHRKTPAGPAQTSLGAGRRTLILLALVAVAGVPAGVLRAFCAGHSCDEPANASSEVPFCSLPDGVRTRVASGFREGRSPDLLAVAEDGGLATNGVPWPSTAGPAATRVPIAFWGAGVEEGVAIPAGTGLDDVAPTIEAILGFDRPHPDVRSGTEIEGIASGSPPNGVVEIVWMGRGSEQMEGRPSELLERTSSTLEGDTTSMPVDPVAVLTTIGTGGRPAQHGITGERVRDDSGVLRKAWSPRSPVSVIATLGDDLDEELRGEPVIGMVATRRAHLGAIGGNWYIDVDEDRFVKTKPGREARDARGLLDESFGADEFPDLAVIAVEGGPRSLERVVREAERLAPGAAFVLTATGTAKGGEDFDPAGLPGDDVAGLVEAVAPGGLFVDQEELASRKVSEDEVLRSLATVRDASGAPLFADAFPAIAVAFGRYC